jgi:hypothetical protein
MQELILYGIGLVALGYFALTFWKKIKGQGGSCCSSGDCGDCGCGSNKDNDK